MTPFIRALAIGFIALMVGSGVAVNVSMDAVSASVATAASGLRWTASCAVRTAARAGVLRQTEARFDNGHPAPAGQLALRVYFKRYTVWA